MKNFKIAEPQTLEQVTSLAAGDFPAFFLLAGGTDLLGEIKDEIINPDTVVDLRNIPDMAYIKEDRNGVRIGAMTTVAELSGNALINQKYPGLREAADAVATPQIRNVATVGGNLCQRPRCWYYRDPLVECRKKGGSRCYASRGKNKYHAVIGGGICHIVHPSDLAPALISMGADITIQTSQGEKTLPLGDFFTPPRANVRKETLLEPFDVVKEITLPLPQQGEKSTYLKFKERGAWDFAVVSAAVTGIVSGTGFKDIRIVLGGVAPIPWRLTQAEGQIKGKTTSESLIREAARGALEK
ncbi:MAG: xanthine dehydrogenase family protein subunit M, partial [Candidatus Aminicenantes bacterium]